MLAILVMLALGQVDSAQEERNWLMSQLMVDLDFDPIRFEDAKAKLARLSPSQVRVLVEVYKTRKEQAIFAEQQQRERAAVGLQNLERYRQQELVNAPLLEAERLRAYKEHLAREAQYQNLVKRQELEVLRKGSAYQKYMMNYLWSRPYPYSGYHRHYYWR